MTTHNNKFFVYLVSCFVLILNTACSSLTDTEKKLDKENLDNRFNVFGKNTKETKVYFTKIKGKDELLFIPVTRKVDDENSFVAESLKELFLGPTKQEELKGIMTEIPIGTRLIKVEQSEDDILIDISSQFVTGGGSAAMQLRYLQIYKTLRKIAPQKKLYLYVDGKPIKTIGGEGLEITQPLTKINDYTQINEKNSNVEP